MMNKARFGLICVLVLAFACAASAAPLRVLILTGENNHDWKSTTPVLKSILEDSGRFKVDVTTQPAALGLDTLKRYGALVDNYNGPRWGEKSEQALLDYVRGGGGLVVIHAANNAFPDWPEYDRLIGGAWREGAGHGKQHAFRMVIADRAHPITRGMPDFPGAEDELYHRMKMQPDAHVLATAFSAPDQNGTGRDEPICWTVKYGKGRVFQNVQGHHAEAMCGAGFALLLRRGTEWAATGKVEKPASPAEAALLGLGERGARSYVPKTQLIALADEAVPVLFDAVQRQDALCGDKARDTLQWIAQRWADSPSKRLPVGRTIMAFAKPQQPTETRLLAIRLTGVIGRDEAVPVLSIALKDGAARSEAAQALALIPGRAAESALIQFAASAPEADAAIAVHALGVRGDKRALPTLTSLARDGKGEARVEAIEAIGRIGGADSLAPLRAVAERAPSEAKNAALDAQLRIAGRCVERGETEAALQTYEQVVAAARTEPQRLGAIAGLGAVGKPESLKALLPYLNDASQPRLQLAAVAALRTVPGADASRALAQAFGAASGPARVAILSAFGYRRDPSAIPVLGEVARGADTDLALVAIRAVGEIGSPEGLRALRAGWGSPDWEARRAAAVTAALAIADAVVASRQAAAGADAGAIYSEVFDLASNDPQRVAALSGLGRCAGKDSVAKIESVIGAGSGAVREAALAALVAAGDTLASASPQEARAVYVKAMDLLPAGPRSMAVAQKLKAAGADIDLAGIQGFVTNWWIAGPFPNANGAAAFDIAYFPENEIALDKSYQVEGRTVKWAFHHADDINGVVDLLELVQPNENMAAYGYAEVTCPAETDGLVLTGSDDGIVVFVNGKRVQGVNRPRGLEVDEDSAPIHLAQGANKILVKVLNGGADYEFCLRLVDANRSPLRLPSRKP